jgi:hypothetical protein
MDPDNNNKIWVSVVYKIEHNDKEIFGVFSDLDKAGAYIDQYATLGEVWCAEEYQIDGP